MWEKIKGILAVIGAVLTVVACTILLIFLRRSGFDGQGGRGADERDTRIQEGIAGCEDAVGRCEEHLQRAEDILRNAINRSRKEEPES